MFVMLGYIITVGCVLGGFILGGGHLGALWQPFEFMIIGGAALGALIASNDREGLVALLKVIPSLFKRRKQDHHLYLELLSCMYEILSKTRKEGLISIEDEVDHPASSAIFSRYKRVTQDARLMEFLTDYLRMLVGGNLNVFEIENLIDNEIEILHEESQGPIINLTKMAEGLPAFGIVGAVMGVVHTMAAVGRPPAELGALIAQALVGTFLGILLSYGFVAPLAQLLEARSQHQLKAYECIKLTLLASMNGYAPATCIEFGRKSLLDAERPSFRQLEDHVRKVRSK